MNITDIIIRKSYDDRAVKAIVSIVIDGKLAIHELKIVEGHERLFVAMPSRKTANGSFRDVVHPLDSGTRAEIERLILEEYERFCAEHSEQGNSDNTD